jgi:hypothetical protein
VFQDNLKIDKNEQICVEQRDQVRVTRQKRQGLTYLFTISNFLVCNYLLTY